MIDRGTVRHDRLRAERWTVRGIAKIAGDVEVGLADLGGTVIVGGSLAARELSVRGSLEAHGTLTASGRFRLHGSLDASASVRAGEASLDGPVRLEGELVAEASLRVRGTLHARGLTSARLDLRGAATIPGTVAATSFEATLLDDSAFGLIQGRDIHLRGPAPHAVRRLLGQETTVTVERIEAETAFVEAARVHFLRAREIVLGRAAHVATVEGPVVRAHPSSRLGPESWSRPPAGLSR